MNVYLYRESQKISFVLKFCVVSVEFGYARLSGSAFHSNARRLNSGAGELVRHKFYPK